MKMEFFELVRTRRSVREFAERPIEREKVHAILEAANRAPSAGNLQGYEIYATTDAARRRELARAALDQQFIARAPVVLVFCANPERSAAKYRDRGRALYSLQDATIACTFAILAAASLGLGTVWVGAFDDDAVWRAIGSPRGLRPVAILPVGYPAEAPEPTPRRDLQDLVTEW